MYDDRLLLRISHSLSLHPSLSSLHPPPPLPPIVTCVQYRKVGGPTLPFIRENTPQFNNTQHHDEIEAEGAINRDIYNRDGGAAQSTLRTRACGDELAFPPAWNPVRPTAPPPGRQAKYTDRLGPGPRHDDFSPRGTGACATVRRLFHGSDHGGAPFMP